LATLRTEHFEKMKAFKSNVDKPSLEQRQEMRKMRSEMGKLMDKATSDF
jgi:hypothetical protein